jgi:hypothetical protein
MRLSTKSDRAAIAAVVVLGAMSLGLGLGLIGALAGEAKATPKVVLISLEGATPRIIAQYLADGTLPPNQGIGLPGGTCPGAADCINGCCVAQPPH